MKKFKKLTLILLVLSLVMVLAVGCGGEKEPAEDADTGDKAPTEDVTDASDGLDKYTKDDPITIKFWNFPNFVGDSELEKGDYDKALIAAFEEANPNIKIEFQEIEFTDGPAKLETAIQSKTNPDVVYDAPGRVIG